MYVLEQQQQQLPNEFNNPKCLILSVTTKLNRSGLVDIVLLYTLLYFMTEGSTLKMQAALFSYIRCILYLFIYIKYIYLPTYLSMKRCQS